MPDIEACPEPVQSTPNWIIIIIIDDDYDEHIKQYEMDLACSMHGWDEKVIYNFSRRTWREDTI